MAKKKDNKKHKKAAAERVKPKPAKDKLKPSAGPPPGMIYQPGTPGVPTPTPDPFFTPDDLLAINDYQTGEAGQLTDLDAMLDQARVSREYDLTQAEDQYKHNVSAAADDMIGRGLFASSVKDAALYDLEATYSLQRTFLNDRYNQVLSEASTRKDQILGSGGSRERFWTAMNQKKVDNATDLAAGQEPYITPPTEGRFVPDPNAPIRATAADRALTRQARALQDAGRNRGKAWRPIIDKLGFDPRSFVGRTMTIGSQHGKLTPGTSKKKPRPNG